MKKLDTTACTATTGFPPKQGTWDFLQAAYTESISAVVQNIIGATYIPTAVYRLYGCTRALAGSSLSVSAGALFYNGEVFLFPAQGLTLTLGENYQVLTTPYATNADPVIFTDGVARNVHNIRTIQLIDSYTGLGPIVTPPKPPVEVNEITALGSPEILTLDHDKINWYLSVAPAGTVSLYLNGVSAGASVKLIFITGTGGNTFSISGTGSPVIITKSGTDSFTRGTHEIDITYLGIISGYPTYSVEYGL